MQEVDQLLASLPQHWRDVVAAQLPQLPLQDRWFVSVADPVCVYLQPATGGPCIRYAVLPTSQMEPVVPCALPPRHQLRPAVVMQ
jgi:hypothetical protein